MPIKQSLCQKKIYEAMQGLSYWLGYQKERYFHHRLREIAIVLELVAMMELKLSKGFRVECEISYKKLGSKKNNDKKRVDIAVYDIGIKKYICAIEVKLLEKKKEPYEEDLKRLRSLKKDKPDIEVYSIVSRIGKLPSEWVTDMGVAIKKKLKTKKRGEAYRVRRICHATPTHPIADKGKFNHGHSVVLIEPC